tara:strand:+ start:2182 stop:2622 length:441 start_codon:yes stop_codon:yes gene_type:complete
MIYEDTKELNKVISAFTVFKFIKAMTTPFNQMDAFKLGIIDSNGKFIKKLDQLTTNQERKSVDAFNRLVINFKKIVAKVPDPTLKANLKRLPTAMILLKDDVEKLGVDGEQVLSEIREYIKEEYGINIEDVETYTINNSFEEITGE